MKSSGYERFSTDSARELMQRFAERTGLDGQRPPVRYLWTDAFAVCNFLELARRSDEQYWLDQALRLIRQVHQVLGRYRDDDKRDGWLSGLDEDEGARHPTRGGLRIGKALPERGANQPFDERLEWDRDGQYFHYLTRWMHALDQAARATGEVRLNRWARELAVTAFNAFSYCPAVGLPRRMHWKMSTDLSRPLVPSMGQHDPLDGWVTCLQLRASAAMLGVADEEPDLSSQIQAFAEMLPGIQLVTADPLGIGGLLADAGRLVQLRDAGVRFDFYLIERLLEGSVEGLAVWSRGGELDSPPDYRLGFRELGLAIGLAVLAASDGDRGTAGELPGEWVERLRPYYALRAHIIGFWLELDKQRAKTWQGHRDINEVMLATALMPAGYLRLSGITQV